MEVLKCRWCQTPLKNVRGVMECPNGPHYTAMVPECGEGFTVATKETQLGGFSSGVRTSPTNLADDDNLFQDGQVPEFEENDDEC